MAERNLAVPERDVRQNTPQGRPAKDRTLPGSAQGGNVHHVQNGLARILVLMWAVVSAAFPGAVGLAHALQGGGDAAAAASHVEAPGSQDCAPVHGAECALCSTLRIVGPAPARAALPDATADGVGAPSCVGAGHATAADPGRTARPRAPPIL